MSETDSDSKPRGRGIGGRSGGPSRSGFGGGRTKPVVVEKKRKRVVTPPGGGAKPAAGAGTLQVKPRAQQPAQARQPEAPKPAEQQQQQKPQPKGRGKMLGALSEEEYSRRLEALKQAKKDDVQREKREAEDADRRRAEDAERARREAEDADLKRKEEDERKRAEAEAVETKRKEEAEAAQHEAAKADASAQAESPDARPAEDDRRAKGRGAAPKKQAQQEKPSRGRGGDERRRAGKLTISKIGADEGGRQRSLAAMRRRQERQHRKSSGSNEPREKVVRAVTLPEAITVQELANRMAERVADVIKALMKNDIMATQNQSIDQDTAELIIEEFGHRVTRVSESDVENVLTTEDDDEGAMVSRAPVVTIMGHVDHGKTSLLDALRKTDVVAGEAGGITQHIGAYQIETEGGHKVTFLDTPGHAAFTSMRARGAQVTDIVVLVVAADDSVMPQTIEAINHAKAAGVPMIVAINKIDRPGADPQKVRTQLLQHEVVVEAMSGEVLDVEVSAITGEGLDKLVDAIVLQSELLELKANPDRPAEGAVVEAKLDVGRGPVATVLIERGTLRTGDIFVAGEQWGRVRALVNDQGERIDEAGPSVPVEVLGLQGTPEAGDVLNVVEDEGRAREIADYRQRKAKEKQNVTGGRATLDQLMAQAKAG
ncbi:MAG TPA: translation initiation factor IF-2, partial [Thermohalobaculum sp.]|nr:translation initiation factor IF-2 [Thermohalobaculum sp.]